MSENIFSHVLVRVGGLPTSVARAFTVAEASDVFAELHDLSTRREPLAEQVADDIYTIVPTLASGDRRRALKARRDVFNGRAVAPEARAKLDGLLTEQTSTDLAALADLDLRADQLRTGLETATLELIESHGAQALELCANDSFAAGLALASPTAYREILQTDEIPDAKLTRTVSMYAIRAAVKTSPFSTLTPIAFQHLSRPQERPTSPNLTTFLGAAARHIFEAAVRTPQLADRFTYRFNPTLRWINNDGFDRYFGLVPMFQHVENEHFWRRDDVIDLQVCADEYQAMRSELIDGMPSPKLRPHLTRFLDMAVLIADAPWQADGDRMAALAETLEGTRVGQLCWDIASDAAKMAHANGAERLELSERVRSAVQESLRVTNQFEPSWISTRSLFYEDAAVPFDLEPVPEPVQGVLEELRQQLAGTFARSTMYDEVRSAFLERFGKGGVCDDVSAFMMELSVGEEAVHRYQRAAIEDSRVVDPSIDGRAELPLAEGVSRPRAFVAFQVVATDADAVANGDFLIVLNQIAFGGVGLFTRYHQLLADNTFAEELAEFASASYGGAPVYELPVGLDANGLQSKAAGCLPMLRWPVETTRPHPGSVELDELTIRHDVDTDAIQIFHQGSPIGIAYAGVVQPALISGPVRQLLALAEPWICTMKLGERVSEGARAMAAPIEIEHSPRQQVGRIVLSREFWRMAADEFPQRANDESWGAFLERAENWRQSHGMPNEVFIRLEQRARGFTANPKPLWFRFDSPLTYGHLERLRNDRTVAILVSEALPSTGEMWMGTDERVSEHVAMLAWPETGEQS